MNRIAIAVALLFVAGWSYAFDYARDGGTADYRCCADKACTQVISQHADSVRAERACGALTDVDGVTRWTMSNPFKISKPGGTPPPPTCPPAPAPTTRTQQCPAGTTGTWQQTSTSTVGPPTACTVTTTWAPATAPAGFCPAIPPPPTAPVLIYSPSVGGTYADLQGATVVGPINVLIKGSCPPAANPIPAGPWIFSVDDVVKNTETFCPYGLIDDASLYDPAQLTNGQHTIKAKSGSLEAAATFTVANPPPPPLLAPQVATPVVFANTANPLNYNVRLTWPPVPGANGYQVERCTGAGCSNFLSLAIVTTLEYTNSNLGGGFTYNYRLRALNATSQGPYSSPPNIVVLAAPGSGSALLEWTPPTQNDDGSTLMDLVGYRVFYGANAQTLDRSLVLPNPGLSSYVVQGLTPGSWYFNMTAVGGSSACRPIVPDADCYAAESVRSNTTVKTVQ